MRSLTGPQILMRESPFSAQEVERACLRCTWNMDRSMIQVIWGQGIGITGGPAGAARPLLDLAVDGVLSTAERTERKWHA